MRALVSAIVLFLALVASPALALDYRIASENEKGLGLIDADTVTAVGENRRVRITAVLPPDADDEAVVMVAWVMLDCSASRYRIEDLDIFDLSLKKIGHEKGGEGWSSANRNSPFTPSADFACRGVDLQRPATQDLKALVDAYLAGPSLGTPI